VLQTMCLDEQSVDVPQILSSQFLINLDS